MRRNEDIAIGSVRNESDAFGLLVAGCCGQMLYSVMLFGTFCVVEAVHSTNKIASNSADSLETYAVADVLGTVYLSAFQVKKLLSLFRKKTEKGTV